MWHLSDAWARRARAEHLLVHYDDLSADLEGQMRGSRGGSGSTCRSRPGPRSSGRPRSSACGTAPTGSSRPAGIFKDTAAFFRRGTSGAGREILSDAEMAAYHARVARLAPPDMLRWLHSPSSVAG